LSYNPFSLQGKTILVTGASSGIGHAIAIHTSMAGARVIINGRNVERLKSTFEKLNSGDHSYVVADLSTNEGIARLSHDLPLLDGVVHSAGINKRLPLKLISDKSLTELMQINFYAPVLLTKSLYKKKLLNQGASIVFISSVAAFSASLGNIMYMASKGAINSFMKGIAFELAESGIRANAIQPGMVKTHLSSALSDEDIEKDMMRYPLKRYGTPEEIAYAAIYLLSDATRWMTGSLLTIDGGLTLR